MINQQKPPKKMTESNVVGEVPPKDHALYEKPLYECEFPECGLKFWWSDVATRHSSTHPGMVKEISKK